jgi:4-coumarate--CoA ligase
MYVGFSLVVMPKFELDKFLQIIQDFRITFIYLVPPVLVALAKHPMVSKYNLKSIRMINSGAAPLTKELVEAVYNRLHLPVKQGYGLSETSPTTHVQVSDNGMYTYAILHFHPSELRGK